MGGRSGKIRSRKIDKDDFVESVRQDARHPEKLAFKTKAEELIYYKQRATVLGESLDIATKQRDDALFQVTSMANLEKFRTDAAKWITDMQRVTDAVGKAIGFYRP